MQALPNSVVALPTPKARLMSLLRDPCLFSMAGGGLRLRRYQQAPARAILRSVQESAGRSIVVMFPRQSGKNELQAQLEAYLLLLFSQQESEIVKVSPTWKPQSLNAMRRLERVLAGNRFTQGRWRKESGYIYRLGKARIFFLSGQPEANIVGATASLLLEVDEAQEVGLEKFDKEIAPMAASTNATRVFWGTAWSTVTLLARELRAAQAAQSQDGIQRVFRIDADEVAQEVPSYGGFVSAQVARMGRQHPLVKTQFYSEELAGEGGMFPPQRIAMMQGGHTAQEGPQSGEHYAFLIDFGGEDPGGGLIEAAMHNPQRDATALTIVSVDLSGLSDPLLRAPRYGCVHRREWRGTSHPLLLSALQALVEQWQPRYIVTDATGLGAPLTSFLQRAYRERVIPFVFSRVSKSKLGWDFLALVDGGRWREFGQGEPVQCAYQKAFYRQLRFTEYRLESGQQLRWGVPDGARDADSGEVLHDDWVLSAALAVVLDGQSFLHTASEVTLIEPPDPLTDMDAGF
ncbi:MAG TPA: hypothetical protein ENN32_03060 [Chloroflexi bacterium]|nr:hypothetical protein [Chloroflexota bacterium]